MKTIAILLTVFNRKKKTLKCLESVYTQLPINGYEVDIYMTNDGCSDGTPEAVADKYPDVHIINAKGDLFWNRGMYTAWEVAAETKDYDYYLWLNDDTYGYNYMLRYLLNLSENKKDKAIIVGATQSIDYTHSTYGGRLRNGQIPNPNGTAVKVCTMNGNIVLIPRYVFHSLGNLDYYFTHSKGDFDYGLRASKKGIEIYQVGKYLGECDAHPTLDKWCDPEMPFKTRWKSLHRPNGMPPKETFHLERRHRGVFIAAIHWCTVYMRCMFPCLWVNK